MKKDPGIVICKTDICWACGGVTGLLPSFPVGCVDCWSIFLRESGCSGRFIFQARPVVDGRFDFWLRVSLASPVGRIKALFLFESCGGLSIFWAIRVAAVGSTNTCLSATSGGLLVRNLRVFQVDVLIERQHLPPIYQKH